MTVESARRWRAAHPDEHRASVAAWRLNNPDKAASKDRRDTELRRLRRLAKPRCTWRKPKITLIRGLRDWSDPAAKAAYFRKWRQDHKAERKAAKVKSRSTKIAILMKLQKGKCAYCRCKLDRADVNVDHILPRALGGKNEISNFQLTCWGCNNEKRAQRPEDFARSLGRLI